MYTPHFMRGYYNLSPAGLYKIKKSLCLRAFVAMFLKRNLGALEPWWQYYF